MINGKEWLHQRNQNDRVKERLFQVFGSQSRYPVREISMLERRIYGDKEVLIIVLQSNPS